MVPKRFRRALLHLFNPRDAFWQPEYRLVELGCFLPTPRHSRFPFALCVYLCALVWACLRRAAPGDMKRRRLPSGERNCKCCFDSNTVFASSGEDDERKADGFEGKSGAVVYTIGW